MAKSPEEQALDDLITPVSGQIDQTIKVFPDRNALDPNKTKGREHRALLRTVVTSLMAWVRSLLNYSTLTAYEATIPGTAVSAWQEEDGTKRKLTWQGLVDALRSLFGKASTGLPASTVLSFENPFGESHDPLIQDGPLTFTLGAGPHVAMVTKRQRVISDGVNPITFSGPFTYQYLGFSEDETLEAGDYEFVFAYNQEGTVSVSVPGSGVMPDAIGTFAGFTEERFTATPYTTKRPTTYANLLSVYWNTAKQRKPYADGTGTEDYSITLNANGTLTINASPQVSGGAGEIIYVATGPEVPVEPDTTPPDAPANQSVDNITETSATVTWSPVSDAAGYNVYLNGTKQN